MAGPERGQPAPDRAGRRELAQATETEDERIAGQVAQVPQPATAAQQQREDDEDDAHYPVVRRRQRPHQLVAQ